MLPSPYKSGLPEQKRQTGYQKEMTIERNIEKIIQKDDDNRDLNNTCQPASMLLEIFIEMISIVIID
jgi:hypothetical protein